ncbi:acetolactate synthase large subunit [Pigmentiphaga kullae]|uniref:Acetolactate synthase-1/2/3 large subunit n=1 Tax=Pigmentiphaga kullae TaxID=151784 RepID=A0A4Q7NI89_9BURK|nr:acetolactate synthase large subunit [Pigmentiphaga kullae]RZS84619.1 acetolactate synthase-1/2/3 large subunit [Pigmentiphaga kullae]
MTHHSALSGADVLCDTLLDHGIDTCFANPGTSEMHFVAALDRKPAMRCVLGLFEGVVTGAADGYARMADKPAATLLHLGPGLANGLANLHNARRAGSPVVNIVGDHARHHLPYDAPLTSDIETLARPMSAWVRTIPDPSHIQSDTATAVAVARGKPGRIATLILPADVAWSDSAGGGHAAAPLDTPGLPSPETMRKVVERLRNGRRTVLMLGGGALRAAPLATASRVAQGCGARLLAPQSNGRMERGAGRVAVNRVPFSVDSALRSLADAEQLILVGARPPVAFFAYPGKPGSLLPAGCEVVELAAEGEDPVATLDWLADELGSSAAPLPLLEAPGAGPLPSGGLTPASLITALGRLMPEHAVLCDESVSSGRDLFEQTRGAAPHDYLQITGGAIGSGLPMATGAAIACPDRRIVCLQADGSGMYTLQALWTQARERLDVVTIILSNRRYAILHAELKNVGAGAAGENARRMLDLDDPALDWVAMARGMGVEGVAVHTVESFAGALRSALARSGPFLIEARLQT